MRKLDSSERAPAQTKQLDLLLYVEDEIANWQVTELRLRRDYRLVHAFDARSACELVEQHRDELSAILMDIQLMGSELDGIQLTQLLRGKLDAGRRPEYGAKLAPIADVPIIFVTAYTARYTREELLAAGGDELIPKPINFAHLNIALTKLAIRRLVPRG